MVAKRLARSSGMDYAVMSGGDVGPLGRAAVTELHRLFDWARASPRGLLLFIDEADAFLASRSRAGMSEDQRNALNALLFQTGEASRHCMLVLASNRPEDLDAAVADRMDEAMLFSLPSLEARERLVRQYLDSYIVRAGEDARWGPLRLLGRSSARILLADDVDGAYLDSLARRTEGFSGREIAKLFIAAQGAVYGGAAPLLDRQTLEETVVWKLREHAAKRSAFSSLAGAPPRPYVVSEFVDSPRLIRDVGTRPEHSAAGVAAPPPAHLPGPLAEVPPLAVPVGGTAAGLTHL